MISYNKKIALINLGAIFLITIDRWFKSVAVNIFDNGSYIAITNWLKLSLSLNKNIAFSLPIKGLLLEILIIILITILIIIYIHLRKKNQPIKASWIFWLIIGSISNLYDRFKYGAVVDYIDLNYFTIFNISDVIITISAISLIYLELKENKEIKNKK